MDGAEIGEESFVAACAFAKASFSCEPLTAVEPNRARVPEVDIKPLYQTDRTE